MHSCDLKTLHIPVNPFITSLYDVCVGERVKYSTLPSFTSFFDQRAKHYFGGYYIKRSVCQRFVLSSLSFHPFFEAIFDEAFEEQ